MKQEKMFKFHKDADPKEGAKVIRKWLWDNYKVIDGDPKVGLDGDDFIQNRISVIVPYRDAGPFCSTSAAMSISKPESI